MTRSTGSVDIGSAADWGDESVLIIVWAQSNEPQEGK